MSTVQDSGAAALLTRATQLDNDGCYQEALGFYQQGIEQLMLVLKESKDETTKHKLKSRVLEFMDRAEKIKEWLGAKKEGERYNKQLRIENDSCGHSYTDIFGPLLDASVTEVEVDDSYVRCTYQIYNFLRFCEMLLMSKAHVKLVRLTTGTPDSAMGQHSQGKQLAELSNSLQQHGIELVVVYSNTLHDREVRFNNGWVVQLGRGLDIYKPPESKFGVGFCELKLRKCHETTINIFHRSHTRTLSRFEPFASI